MRFPLAATTALLTVSLAACGNSTTSHSPLPPSSTTRMSIPVAAKPSSAAPRTMSTKTDVVLKPTTQQCAPASEKDAVNRHIGSVPANSFGHPWIIDSYYKNTYKPCSSLSFVPLTFMGATGDSPEQIMLFHNGTYLGTATTNGYATNVIEQNGDNSIRVQYVDGNHNTYWTTFTYTGGTPLVSMTGTDPSTLN